MSKHKKQDEVDGRAARMKRKPYEAEMCSAPRRELVATQEWVKATGAKICIVLQGRYMVCKGGTIKPES